MMTMPFKKFLLAAGLLLTTACTNIAVRSAQSSPPSEVQTPPAEVQSSSPTELQPPIVTTTHRSIAAPTPATQSEPVPAQRPVETKTSTAAADTVTLSNGEWTVTIGNLNSWSGVNNTGNLSYRGCNAQGDCLSLTGGTAIARQGILSTTWQNGDYFYVVESPIVENTSAEAPSNLLVYQADRLILRASGLRSR